AVDARIAARAEARVTVRGVTLELLADVNGEGREVAEVKALELVVACNHDDVGVHLGELLAQSREALLDALLLREVVLERVHRDVRPERAVSAHFVPALRCHVAEGGVGRVNNAYDFSHGILLVGGNATLPLTHYA